MSLYPLQLEIALAVMALLVLIREALRPVGNGRALGLGLAALVLGLLAYSFTMDPVEGALYSGMYRLDGFALFSKRLFLLALALALALAAEFAPRLDGGWSEQYVITLLAAVGMLLIGSVNDFALLFVALELVTISFYVLTSYLRRQLPSLEAGTKYLIIGALSGSLTMYGIAYLFGATGTTNLDQVALALRNQGGAGGIFLFGMVLVLAGLSFKLAAFPGQMWAPDVYQGAPAPVTAFLAVGSKAAGFVLLVRLLYTGFLGAHHIWGPLLLWLAAITLLYGNLGALYQHNLKRLLGYSSIAHAGYLLLGAAAFNIIGVSALLFYLVQYACTVMCAFLAIVALGRATGSEDLDACAGLHRRSPLLAAALVISMLSLAGLPPLSGFFGKLLLLLGLFEKVELWNSYMIVAILASAGVVASFYYYFGVARAVYLDQGHSAEPIALTGATRLGLVLCIGAILFLGIYQRPLFDAAVNAALVLAPR
ncbi:MAG: NADH-quinone oxidoreductase subunit N [Candidatus Handelsmanbacteria bacterium]|nr:NADH-quinone oxidoreductase subunit N [Candidatus Handelsmanbacteria bacterium]